MSEQPPVRVLHIVGKLDRGGVETWLLQLLRHCDRTRFQMDVLVHSAAPGALDDEARELGASIIPCSHLSNPAAYARTFLQVLRCEPGYDVVHSHVHHFSALPLELARRAGVPVRVAHSHTDMSAIERTSGHARRMYLGTARRLLRWAPTDRLAVSSDAGRALFGSSWRKDERDRVLPYGTDLSRFSGDLDPTTVRAALGVPPGSFVVGHVGRFASEKNHPFLLDVLAEISRRQDDAVLLLVGTGPLLPDVQESVAARGLSGRVIFAGPRSDVPDLMRAAMDVFLLPSIYEGLPIVGIEAQAAGLPCIFSDVVTRESSVIPQLTRYLPLGDAATWARAVLELKRRTADRRAPSLEGGPFDLRTCIEVLAGIYARSPAREHRASQPDRQTAARRTRHGARAGKALA